MPVAPLDKTLAYHMGYCSKDNGLFLHPHLPRVQGRGSRKSLAIKKGYVLRRTTDHSLSCRDRDPMDLRLLLLHPTLTGSSERGNGTRELILKRLTAHRIIRRGCLG